MKEFKYNEIPGRPSDKTFRLDGYFQSYKYFEKEQDQIYSLIRLDKHKDTIRNEASDLLNGPTIISMHFRLGDYKEIQDTHPILNYHYYYNSLKYLITQDKNYNVLYVFICIIKIINIVKKSINPSIRE